MTGRKQMRGTLMRSTQNPSYFSSKDILSNASGDGCGSGNFLCITYGSFCNRGNYSEKFKVMTTLVKAIPSNKVNLLNIKYS